MTGAIENIWQALTLGTGNPHVAIAFGTVPTILVILFALERIKRETAASGDN